jgi:hypothetical protein
LISLGTPTRIASTPYVCAPFTLLRAGRVRKHVPIGYVKRMFCVISDVAARDL